MKTLADLRLKGKRALLRVDINSGISDGKLDDDTRIRSILPTIEYLQKHGVTQIVLLAHQGREKKRSAESVLDLHAKRLEQLLKQKVLKFDRCRGLKIPKEAKIVMLENLRLDDEDHPERAKRVAFAKVLAKYGDAYVNDAFGACHRDHSSISELPKLMKDCCAGLLLETEIQGLRPLVQGMPESPFTIVMGGAKIDTKIDVLNFFANKADAVLLGGGIANTFLFAEGFDIGASLCEEDRMETAQELAMKLDGEKSRLHLPTDAICADEVSEDADTLDAPVEDIMGDMKILDIGKKTAEHFSNMIRKSRTVIWNGPMGVSEMKPFRSGTEAIIKAMAACKGRTVIGGGESLAALQMLGIPHKKFSHVSTGGGAMLEYLAGKKLPGIAALG